MPAPEARLYRYVVYKQSTRGPSGWVAQVPAAGKQVTLGGVVAKQVTAAQLAAKHLKVTVDSLRLTAGSRGKKVVKKPLKRHVYQRGPSFYVVTGKDYHGTFKTATEAAEKAAEVAGDTADGKPAKLKAQSCKPAELLERLRAAMPLYSSYDPPDLANLKTEMKLCQNLWRVEPALAYLSAAGKYGPWRASLRQHAAQVLKKRSSGLSPQARVTQLLTILKQTVTQMQHEDDSLWYENCGRGVHHHCSWLPMMQRLKLIAKWKAGAVKLKLGKQDVPGPHVMSPARAEDVDTGAYQHLSEPQLHNNFTHA